MFQELWIYKGDVLQALPLSIYLAGNVDKYNMISEIKGLSLVCTMEVKHGHTEIRARRGPRDDLVPSL